MKPPHSISSKSSFLVNYGSYPEPVVCSALRLGPIHDYFFTMEQHSYSNEEAANIIVSDSLMHSANTNGPSNTNFERELRKLLTKDMKLKWEIVSLSDYWREKRIPRGLRLHHAPSYGFENADFKSKWESILNKCSMDLILLLIEDAKRQREALTVRLTELETSLPLTAEQQIPFQDKIKEEIYKLETTVKEMKVAKLQRVAYDYEHGHEYRWDRSRRTPRHTQHPQRTQTDGNKQRRPEVSFTVSSGDERGSTASASTDHDQENFFEDESWPSLPAPQTAPKPSKQHVRKRGGGATGAQHITSGETSTPRSILRNQPRKTYTR